MSDQQPPPLDSSLKLKLSVMMLLQYAIWGAWLPLLWPYLSEYVGMSGKEIGTLFSVGAVGAIVAPFIAGQIADRYFNTEKFLGLSHIVGAVLVYQLASITGYWAFLAFSLLYSLIYSPTLSLTNSLAFHHLPDRDRDFGRVRVWGTVGWILVGIGIGQWLAARHTLSAAEARAEVFTTQLADPVAREALDPALLAPLSADGNGKDAAAVAAIEAALRRLDGGEDPNRVQADLLGGDFHFAEEVEAAPIRLGQVRGMADAFRLSALLGLLMGLFCFTLPATPPSKSAETNAAFAALGEVRHQPLLTLFLLAVPISCIHQFYFVHTAGFLGRYQLGAAAALNRIFGVGGGGLMTVGQMTEIGVLALIPLVARRLSRKTLLGIGILAYGLRMALFAYVDAIPLPEIVTLILGVGMHGLCFGCFIFVAFMVVDEESSPDRRASAQSLFNLVIIGVGIIVGSLVAGWVAEWASRDGAMDYTRLFSVPMYASLACLLALLLFYPSGRRRVPSA